VDDIAEILEEEPGQDSDDETVIRKQKAPAIAAGERWFGRLEGLKLLRRRFVNVAPDAAISVNSGHVYPDGSWDAQRTEAVGRENPGIYVMEWKQPQRIAALAFKEVDGAVTEIDVWQGPRPAEIPLSAPALEGRSNATGWKHVATYRQRRRSAYHPSADRNHFARYIDGYVDFDDPIVASALRLRIVEQWLDNGDKNAECRRHDGRSEHGLHYTQSYAARLDTRLCRVEGVAVLSPMEGEPAGTDTSFRRLEVRDGMTGAVLREWPLHLGWHGMTCDSSGRLIAIDGPHRDVLVVNPETGSTSVLVPDCSPDHLAVGPDGLIYVHRWTNGGTDPIAVYDGKGRLVREIGEAGGHAPGLWNPRRFGRVGGIAVASDGNLWVLETQDYPRRIVQYGPDGRLLREILGNTFYGGTGGGTINRYNPRRAWYGPVEFELDLERGASRIRALLSSDMPTPDFAAFRPPGRTDVFLASMPLSLDARQQYGVVYSYDEAKGTAKMVAAMGDAGRFMPLRSSAVVSLLEGRVPKEFTFVWSDTNLNGNVDACEVDFKPKENPLASCGVGPFDENLGCLGGGEYYCIARWLEGGVPVYERRPAPSGPLMRWSDGSMLALGEQVPDRPDTANFTVSAKGDILWQFPATKGVSGLYVPPWEPGRFANQFGIIGHGALSRGDLGEFVVVHANTGEWTVWTRDGFPAGRILLHKAHPQARLFGPQSIRPGDRLDHLSAGQEHFHGFFTVTEPDERCFIIAGFTHMSVVEVVGLDRVRRFNAEFSVTAADIERARQWEAQRVRRQIESRALVAVAPFVKEAPRIDGERSPAEWQHAVALDASESASFAAAYDRENLYVCWASKDLGPVNNSGSDFRRIFKTGGGVDLFIGCDPSADPARVRPAPGDARIVIASVNDHPLAVLYQPTAAGAAASEKWTTRTEAGGETSFDRVVPMKEASVAINQKDRSFVVEAAIPWRVLGWAVPSGRTVKMDWGVLMSRDGVQVQARSYWANKKATGTSDEAVEARLEPGLWGYLRFEEGGAEELDSLLEQ